MPKYFKQATVQGKKADELYAIVSKEIEAFLAKLSIGKFDVHYDSTKKSVTFKASMASAEVRCTDATITLDGSISLMAVPFKSKIDGAIERWVGRMFGPENTKLNA